MGEDVVGWQVELTLELGEYDIACTCHGPTDRSLRERMAFNIILVMSHHAVLAYLDIGKNPIEIAIALATARLAEVPVYLVDKWGGHGVEFLRAIATKTFDSIDDAVNHIKRHGV